MVRNRLIVAVAVAAHISSGKFSKDLERYKTIGKLSEADTLIPTYVILMESIDRLVRDARMMADAAVEGRLDARIDNTQHQGEYRDVVEGINHTLDAVIGPLNVAAEYIDRISKGDIPEKISDSYNGDFNEIKNNLNACIDGLGGLEESSRVLKKMAINDYTSKVEGQYQGIFAETAVEVNTVRDTLLRIVATMTNIAAGDFSEDLERYREIGRRCEEDKLIPAFIMSMENIDRLVGDAKLLADAAVQGKLDFRADCESPPRRVSQSG